MKEYRFQVERSFTGKVRDTYDLVADSKEQAIELFKEILHSPVDMATLTHETKIDNDEIIYNDDIQVSITPQGDHLLFSSPEYIDLEDLTESLDI